MVELIESENMTWASATRKHKQHPVAHAARSFCRPFIPQHTPDWARLVSLDFETFWDADYTLSKLSTSEYVRDPRFKAQMCGIKVGNGKTRVIPAARIKTELKKINWSTHSLLCHNTQFDAFILSHHYDIHPVFLYDSLAMARGLHSNDIGAGLDEVSIFYGGQGKLEGLEATNGVLNWPKPLYDNVATYCANDVDEMLRVFKLMLPKMPADEIELIDIITRMFTSPVLKVDIPRVEKELARELADREAKFYAAVNPRDYDLGGKLYDKSVHAKLLKGPAERALTGVERDIQIIKRVVGSSEMFADLLRAEGVEPPEKISPAWMKLNKDERESEEGLARKYAYAFAKDDLKFTDLPNMVDEWGFDLNKPSDVALMVVKQERLQALVDVRIAVKSTTNITRAQRFLTAGANGMSLPVGYAYSRAHTHRLGGANKMNMQNLMRGGELRLSILADKGHVLCVQDSGQIECRVNGWLWGQDDLLDAFRDADKGVGRDAYCNFADLIYGREITKADKEERFVGKVCVLGLGFQMGAPKLQITFAKGALGGPPVYFELDKCKSIVNTYRMKNARIQAGWKICERIIEDMAAGREGSHGPLSWEAGKIWLPNGMTLNYPDLKKSMGDKGWDEWSYHSTLKGVPIRKKIYGGLLCLGAKTQVLTNNGWKSIIFVRLDDKLWDGANWVSHSGLVHQGTKETINFGGVDMTPDHEVLVDNQWFAAEETTHHEATSSFARHYRAPDRHADSSWSDWQRWPTNSVDSSVPVWKHPDSVGHRIYEGQHEELWMFNDTIFVRVKNNTRHVEAPCVLGMAQYAGPLQTTYASVLGALRWAWNHSVRGLEQVRKFLGRHGTDLPGGSGFGPRKEFSGVQAGELPLGNSQGQCSQHSRSGFNRDADRLDPSLASSRDFGYQEHNLVVSEASRVAHSQDVRQTGRQKQEVFDLIDAGPLQRFTVRGDDGQPFIVHNCENIVQALARIIVMWQMLQISKKYRCVMTTHDEVVAMPKKAQADACLKFMAKWMSTAPSWCNDIPLNCEGGWDVNYSK